MLKDEEPVARLQTISSSNNRIIIIPQTTILKAAIYPTV
jgi:hypothetical protein